MKNQNDLIFSIVFGVLGLVAFGIAIATKPEPPTIPAPPQVVTSDAALPATAVVYGNALPNVGTTSGGGASGVRSPFASSGGGSGGRSSGPPGGYPGGPPGGFGGRPSGGSFGK